ncbi:IS30 family transposase [Leadbettera azotonutricia]|uniref:Transposase InsI for insertion sequence element IS30B/C/D n=1 Tax=Leadbettera azotonutricia (strain ATCC BAA-888 / DSM 13862 / ZAS-9) TaxID=545695 RepID=F5YAV8_LEAAZ|nr:IS30 family transposase [Leadbettera azotonutricia]AEF81837.1 transposase InsI for insertion sequence element IS30B/C/D [Leadbettera azotonutricia ZAS-9]
MFTRTFTHRSVVIKKFTPKSPEKYTQLTLAEREEISLGRNSNTPVCETAAKLGRSPSTIYRELKRGRPCKNNVQYRAHKAQMRSDERKKAGHFRERIPNKEIKAYIVDKLRQGWSPELIAGRLAKDNRSLKTNYETIYQWIYEDRPDLFCYLVRHHKKRRDRGSAKGKRLPKVLYRTMIGERPRYIDNRKEFGHWEADTAISRQSKAAIMATVERKTRFLLVRKIKSKSAPCMHEALVKCLGEYSLRNRMSITYDNGTENAFHLATNNCLNTKSYFCNPYHSWEKGSIENRIGILRRYFPKKTNWILITQAQIDKVVKEINSRPMKRLGFRTPYEAFVALRS